LKKRRLLKNIIKGVIENQGEFLLTYPAKKKLVVALCESVEEHIIEECEFCRTYKEILK
jgi:hypothetical protein